MGKLSPGLKALAKHCFEDPTDFAELLFFFVEGDSMICTCPFPQIGLPYALLRIQSILGPERYARPACVEYAGDWLFEDELLCVALPVAKTLCEPYKRFISDELHRSLVQEVEMRLLLYIGLVRFTDASAIVLNSTRAPVTHALDVLGIPAGLHSGDAVTVEIELSDKESDDASGGSDICESAEAAL